MANRRMISKDIVYNSDFIKLSAQAQALYMHLMLSADDDGFTNEVSTCMFRAHAIPVDLEQLILARFIHQFHDGVVVITHWGMQNSIRKDRYTPTIYQEDLKALEQCDGKYLLGCDIPNGNQMATSDCHSIGKVSLGEFSTIVSNETNIHCPFTKDVIDYLNLKTGSNYKHTTKATSIGKVSLGEFSTIVSNETNIHCPFTKDVIDYLNLKTGSNYKHTTKATIKYINARYKEGFSLDDFKHVIDVKCNQWINDPKMKQYLRPETLFSTKFESYLNQQEVHTFQGLPDLKSNAPAKVLTPEEIEEENNKHYDF